jgi:hypothetical protein
MMNGIKFLFAWILSGAAGAPLGMGGEEICSALVAGDVLGADAGARCDGGAALPPCRRAISSAFVA